MPRACPSSAPPDAARDPRRRAVLNGLEIARRAALAAALGLGALLMLTPPASAQPRPGDAIQTWTHASGAQVFLVEKHDFPYVTWNVTLRTGGLWDPTDKVGLASLTLNMLPRGAGTRDREAIEAELDQLGAAFASDVGRSAMELDGDAIRRNLDAVMAIVGELLTHPTFPPEELEKLKRQREAEIKRVRDNDQTLNGRFFRRYLFGPHPWGQPSDGTLAGIANVQLADVQAFYKAHVVASNIIFGFSGDVTRADLDKLLDAHFADLPHGEAPALTLSAHPKLTGRQVLLVDKPDRTQNQILIGHFAPTADSPDLYALDVVNTIFGGTFTARLNHEVRDQRGLSYGAYSTMDHDPFAGVFSMWTYPASEDALKTINLLVELFEQLKREPLRQEELEFVQQYLVNSFAFRIDTPADLLDEAIDLAVEHKPITWLDTYTDEIRAVTLEQANKAVQSWLDPDNFLLVMLCTAAGFEEPMQKLRGVTTVKVVPYDAPF